MIVDKLFQVDNAEDLLVPTEAEPTHQLSQIEENAIYYAVGYVAYKLIKKYRQKGRQLKLWEHYCPWLVKMLLGTSLRTPAHTWTMSKRGPALMIGEACGMYLMIHIGAFSPLR